MSRVRLSCLALAVTALAAIWTAAPAAAGTATFLGTGTEQSFTVPAGVTSVRVIATGAGGADLNGNSGGRAAVVTATLVTPPRQVFYVEVGMREGFGGGGMGGGGGASDVRSISLAPPNELLSLESRILVAAGGGGAGKSAGATGGNAGEAGGALSGSPECAGGPGAAAAGGTSGEPGGEPGTAGKGGDGVDAADGGGGGGGLFGGGSSGSTSGMPAESCGGGGGGSSKVLPGGTLALAATSNTPAQVTFSWDDPPPPPDVVPPQLGGLTINPAAFRAKGTVASGAVGASVRYQLSEPATVAFTIERILVGHRRGKRCVAGTGQGQRCQIFRKVRGGFGAQGAAGPNRVRFTGRLRGKALPPGRYRLVAIATDAAGNGSQPTRRSYRILAPAAG